VAENQGVFTFTANNIEENATLSADDFDYAVPPGVRLVRPRNPVNGTGSAATSALQTRQRNTCINTLRQIDAAKNQWALEKAKRTATPSPRLTSVLTSGVEFSEMSSRRQIHPRQSQRKADLFHRRSRTAVKKLRYYGGQIVTTMA